MTEEIFIADKLVSLDKHRDIKSLNNILAPDGVIRIHQDELEDVLQTTPATTLLETAAKAKYLIQLFSTTAEASDPRRQALIESTLNEIDKFFD